jgi:hypothetical protein
MEKKPPNEPGGKARLSTVLRYTVLARPGLDVRAAADAFQRVAGAEAGEVVMSTTEPLVEQGIRQILELQLTECFGPLPQAVKAQLAAATADTLLVWAKRVRTAQRLDDVFASEE